MKSVEDKIIEVLNELDKWESRREKVKERYDRGDADKTEIERINEQISHYKNLSKHMYYHYLHIFLYIENYKNI